MDGGKCTWIFMSVWCRAAGREAWSGMNRHDVTGNNKEWHLPSRWTHRNGWDHLQLVPTCCKNRDTKEGARPFAQEHHFKLSRMWKKLLWSCVSHAFPSQDFPKSYTKKYQENREVQLLKAQGNVLKQHQSCSSVRRLRISPSSWPSPKAHS